MLEGTEVSKRVLTRHDAGTDHPWVEFRSSENKQLRCEMPERDQIGEQRHIIDTIPQYIRKEVR